MQIATDPNISIHASAKEATPSSLLDGFYVDFNPRLREGGDFYDDSGEMIGNDFNPRLREGGDSFQPRSCHYSQNFNPRLREGGDVMLPICFIGIYISIHASAKEATMS